MNRKTYILILVFFVLIALVACTQLPAAESTLPETKEQLQATETSFIVTEPAVPEQINTAAYSIFWEDDRCYMKFKDTAGQNSNTPESALISANYPEFSSVKEMKQALLTGNLSPEEITELMRYASKETNIVEICNIETFYEATVPAGYTIDHIQFTGRGYNFTFDGDDESWVWLCHLVKEDYDNKYRSLYKGEGRSKGCEDISNEVSADGKKSILTYRFNGNTFKQIRYSITTAYGQMDIKEQYTVTETSENTIESITRVDVFGNDNGVRFYAVIMDIEEPPTEEWLSAFGLREYVETEVS